MAEIMNEDYNKKDKKMIRPTSGESCDVSSINQQSKVKEKPYNLRKKKLDEEIVQNENKRMKKCTKAVRDCLYFNNKVSYGDGSIYEGGMENNIHQGYGTLKTLDYTYEGYWKDGKYNGKGKFSNSFFEYDGYWKDNLKHGFGQVTIREGSIRKSNFIRRYSGNFSENKLVGRFNIVYIDANYQGEITSKFIIEIFNEGLSIPIPDGEGEIEYFSGGKYEGYFSSGSFSGEGVYITNGNRFIGLFSNNKILKGSKITDSYEYNGNFKDYKMHGKGIMNLKNGSHFNGRFLNDDFHYGVLTERGLTYKGHFRNYKLHGRGCLVVSSNEVYVGMYQNGVLIDPSRGKAKCTICRTCSDISESCKVFTNSKCNICDEGEKPMVLFGECRHAITCFDCSKRLIRTSYEETIFNIEDEFEYLDGFDSN